MYDKLVTKVNVADDKVLRTYGIVTKIQHDIDKHDLENKIEGVYKEDTWQ